MSGMLGPRGTWPREPWWAREVFEAPSEGEGTVDETRPTGVWPKLEIQSNKQAFQKATRFRATAVRRAGSLGWRRGNAMWELCSCKNGSRSMMLVKKGC